MNRRGRSLPALPQIGEIPINSLPPTTLSNASDIVHPILRQIHNIATVALTHNLLIDAANKNTSRNIFIVRQQLPQRRNILSAMIVVRRGEIVALGHPDKALNRLPMSVVVTIFI